MLLGPFNESLVVDWGLAKVVTRPVRRAESVPIENRSSDAVPSLSEEPDAEAKEDRECAVGLETIDGDEEEAATEPNATEPLGVTSSTDTAAGIAFGTPAYMSPEQADGKLDQLGPASDVYSLGAMLYTLLCGKVPFEHVWCDVTGLIDRVRHGEFTAPRKVNAHVSPALEAICLKAMALDPAHRYASAGDLSKDIDRWLADEPVSAYREPLPARLARWGRQHKPVVAGAAALLITAVALLSGGILLLGREQRKTEAQRRHAVQERIRADAKTVEATQRAEDLRRRDTISRVNLAYREYLDDNVALADKLVLGCPEDLREWEWSYAHRLGHAELKTYSGSTKGQDIWCVAFSPDGTLLASGSGPWSYTGAGPTGEVALRAVQTGTQVWALRGLTGAVQALAFSPDGRRLAVARGFMGETPGSVLSVVEVESGQRVWEVAESAVHVLSVTYSPDGRTVAAGCGWFNNPTAIGYVRLRDAATGSPLGEPIRGSPGGVLDVAFAPDGNQIALASRDVTDIYDIASPNRPIVMRLRGHVNFVYAVSFSPDGRCVVTGGWDKTIRLWDRATGAQLQTLIGHRGFVRGLAFSADGAQLVSCSEDKSVRRWELSSGAEIGAFHGHTGFVHAVAFSPDGTMAASGSQDGTIKIWPAAAPDTQVTFRNSAGWVGTVALAPDSRRAATAHLGNIRIWDPRTGEEQHRLTGPSELMGHIALTFSPDGSILAAGGRGSAVNLWDTATWVRRCALEGHAGLPTDADFSPDGKLLATASADGTIRIWDIGRTTTAMTLVAHAGGVNAVAFAPDGRRLVSGGQDHEVKIWDVTTGNNLAVMVGHQSDVRDVAFAPDGRTIASAGGLYHGTEAAEVKIWDSFTGRQQQSLQGHTSMVTAVAFFPGGRRLATASDDRTIKLWDIYKGDDVFTLRGHTSGVLSLAVSRDSRFIVSGSIDYSAKTWSAASPTSQIAAELSLRRAAVERVQSLYDRHLLKGDVLKALRADETLSLRLRQVALEIAEQRTENASRLYEAGWLTVIRSDGRTEDYRLALRRLEAACRVIDDDPQRLAQYRHALALAYYRTDQPARALGTLGFDNAIDDPNVSPLVLVIAAMAQKRLGRTNEANITLTQLRRLVISGQRANDQEARLFLNEVDEVMRKPSPSADIAPRP